MIRQSCAKLLLPVVLGCALAAQLAPQAKAETIPLPTIDYEAKARLINDGTLLVRHANGKIRIEMQMPQLKEPAVGYIDLKRKVMVMTLPIRGVQDTAFEIEFGDETTFGQVAGQGKRSGEDTVAGERCTIWQVTSAGSEHSATACLSSDNIALRTQAVIDGKHTTVFEVTELKRQRQNPAELEVPSNLNVMKLPKGVKGIPGLSPR